MRQAGNDPVGSAVELLTIPLGAGGHVVRANGRVYEAISAFRDRRPRCALYHTALRVTDGRGSIAIEVTPIPSGAGDRGVVAEGPVGLRWLGRFRLFRYEVRAWRGGEIPDAAFAVGGPVRLSDDPEVVRRLLAALPDVPTPVWGRDELRAGDMWNSNAVVSWLLVRAGVDVDAVRPPAGGRAPGWDAGIVVARRATPAPADV
jgi:hypothetical protein